MLECNSKRYAMNTVLNLQTFLAEYRDASSKVFYLIDGVRGRTASMTSRFQKHFVPIQICLQEQGNKRFMSFQASAIAE